MKFTTSITSYTGVLDRLFPIVTSKPRLPRPLSTPSSTVNPFNTASVEILSRCPQTTSTNEPISTGSFSTDSQIAPSTPTNKEPPIVISSPTSQIAPTDEQTLPHNISLNPQVKPAKQSLLTQIIQRIMTVWRKHFPPHELHDKKYIIALQTQRDALKENLPLVRQFYDRLRNANGDKLHYYQSIYMAMRVLNSEHSDIRIQYQMYHHYLREAINSKHYKDDDTEAKKILFLLCKAKFEKNFMLKYHQECQTTGGVRFLSENSDLSTFANDLTSANQQLKHPLNHLSKSRPAQNKQKLEGNEFLPGADNMGKSNIPEVRSRHEYTNRSVLSLRHGTAIISPNGYKREVAPEYQCYLDSLKAEKKNLLYINHQRAAHAPFFDQSEVGRSAKLHQIDTGLGVFHCFSLPMDGPVFASKESSLNTSIFKKRLIDSLKNQTNGFQMPKSLLIGKQDLKTDAIFDFVHSHFFNSQSELTAGERQEFLMIYYFYLKERVKHVLKIDTVVTVCKDNKDRGNASATIDELLLAYHTEKGIDSPFLQNLHSRFLGAFMIKFEAIIDKRVQLVTSIANRLQTLRPKIDTEYGQLIGDDPSYKPIQVVLDNPLL